MLWGLMETYGWNTTSGRPKGFGYKFGSSAPKCEQRGSFIYPVHFAKGPLYFVSSKLVAQLSASTSVREAAARAIDSSSENGVPSAGEGMDHAEGPMNPGWIARNYPVRVSAGVPISMYTYRIIIISALPARAGRHGRGHGPEQRGGLCGGVGARCDRQPLQRRRGGRVLKIRELRDRSESQGKSTGS